MSENETPKTEADGSVERGVRPLVERLRSGVYGLDRIPLCAEAADEIERLRGIVPEVLERLNDELCAENERLRAALRQANTQAEYFERQWYLRGDALEFAVRQNEHDMLMTGDELRACRAALAGL